MSPIVFLLLISIWVGLSLAVARFAKTRGRDFGQFLVISLFISPMLAFVILASIAPTSKSVVTPVEDTSQANPFGNSEIGFQQKLAICPYCAEEVRLVAKVCKHCGKDIDVDLSRIRKQLQDKFREEQQAVIAQQKILAESAEKLKAQNEIRRAEELRAKEDRRLKFRKWLVSSSGKLVVLTSGLLVVALISGYILFMQKIENEAALRASSPQAIQNARFEQYTYGLIFRYDVDKNYVKQLSVDGTEYRYYVSLFEDGQQKSTWADITSDEGLFTTSSTKEDGSTQISVWMRWLIDYLTEKPYGGSLQFAFKTETTRNNVSFETPTTKLAFNPKFLSDFSAYKKTESGPSNETGFTYPSVWAAPKSVTCSDPFRPSKLIGFDGQIVNSFTCEYRVTLMCEKKDTYIFSKVFANMVWSARVTLRDGQSRTLSGKTDAFRHCN
jgi:phosphate/sulfate permease